MTIIEGFVERGFLVVRNAVAPDVLRACVAEIEDELRERAVDTHDPATWTQPVVRVNCLEGPSFAAAGTASALWELYDALIGPGK